MKSTEAFAAREKVNVHIETTDGTEVHSGEFVAMDESGVLIRRRGEYVFFPPQRILMIGTAVPRPAS